MIIGIIGAMEEEVELLLEDLKVEKKLIKAGMTFSYGELKSKKVVVVKSGIGKVHAALCSQILIDDFKVTHIINIGIAGGVGPDIYPGDIVVANDLVQHDMDTSAFGDKIGQIPGLDRYELLSDSELVLKAKEACASIEGTKTYLGRIISGDQFIASAEKIRWFNTEFAALACEMEGASIAQACYLNNIPFVVIRSISDNASNGAHIDYAKFKEKAVEISSRVIKKMLELL